MLLRALRKGRRCRDTSELLLAGVVALQAVCAGYGRRGRRIGDAARPVPAAGQVRSCFEAIGRRDPSRLWMAAPRPGRPQGRGRPRVNGTADGDAWLHLDVLVGLAEQGTVVARQVTSWISAAPLTGSPNWVWLAVPAQSSGHAMLPLLPDMGRPDLVAGARPASGLAPTEPALSSGYRRQSGPSDRGTNWATLMRPPHQRRDTGWYGP